MARFFVVDMAFRGVRWLASSGLNGPLKVGRYLPALFFARYAIPVAINIRVTTLGQLVSRLCAAHPATPFERVAVETARGFRRRVKLGEGCLALLLSRLGRLRVDAVGITPFPWWYLIRGG